MFNLNVMARAAHNVLVKRANAVTSIESALARRGASAISRAVPTAAEGALGHATAAAASRAIPRNVSEFAGAAGSGVRAIPKGPPPVPAQAKGLFGASAVSPFAGTAPGPAPNLGVGARIPGVRPMPPGSTQRMEYLAKQPMRSPESFNPNPALFKLSELIEKFAGTGHEYSASAMSKPKKMKSRRGEPQLSGSFAQLVERLGAGAA